MLEDTERKILQILWALYKHEWVRPDIDKVSRLSVRSVDRVRTAIKGLVAKDYIEIGEGRMRILLATEPEPPKPEEPPKWKPVEGMWLD